jgi:hypothetical protein
MLIKASAIWNDIPFCVLYGQRIPCHGERERAGILHVTIS